MIGFAHTRKYITARRLSMKEAQTICLLNDSFPPQYDGVAAATANYAKELHSAGHNPLVVTPSNPQARDDFPYPVLRYPSVAFRKLEIIGNHIRRIGL